MTTDFRARAALSAPEQGPTDEDLYDVAEVFNGDPIPAMRRALELWGRPAVEPVPEGPTEAEIMELMPEQLREDLATVARLAAHGAAPDVGPGLFRVTLNTGIVEHCRAVLARWGRPAVEPVPVSEWHEDIGDALWWRFPIEEPPYVGSPLDTDWPGYHTHFSLLPVPQEAKQ